MGKWTFIFLKTKIKAEILFKFQWNQKNFHLLLKKHSFKIPGENTDSETFFKLQFEFTALPYF